MALTLSAVNQSRFHSDVLRVVSKWLAYYLGTEYATAWGKVGGGVNVYLQEPNVPPQAALAKPLVVLRHTGETGRAQTVDEQPDPEHPGETALYNLTYMRLGLEARCVTDDKTGKRLTCYDLVSAVRRICEQHGSDLLQAGLLYVSAEPGEVAMEDETGLWSGVCNIEVEFGLLGEKVS